MVLERGRLGYAIEHEKANQLVFNGLEPAVMMANYRDQFPQNNPVAFPSIIPILDQGQQGSCQGHALAQIFTICYFLATGRIAHFSRAAGYYLSQRYDGLIGRDVGSTLSGGQRVATDHGMCPEYAWPYPSSYRPNEPSGINYEYKLAVSKPITDIDTLYEVIDLGLPVQTGMIWDSSCDQEVVSNYVGRGGGGHSTVWWTKTESGNVRNINSWGKNWNGDGIHEWTRSSLARALSNRSNVFICYAPDNMLYPLPPPAG